MTDYELDRGDDLPRDSYQLIDLLDKSFPHRCIGPTEDYAKAQRRAGWRDLIDHLVQAKNDEQTRDADEVSRMGADGLPTVLS